MKTRQARTIDRDCFARTELKRRVHILVNQVVDSPQVDGCSWCGSYSRTGKLFRYGTQNDGTYSRTQWHKGQFCSKGCHDTYHEA